MGWESPVVLRELVSAPAPAPDLLQALPSAPEFLTCPAGRGEAITSTSGWWCPSLGLLGQLISGAVSLAGWDAWQGCSHSSARRMGLLGEEPVLLPEGRTLSTPLELGARFPAWSLAPSPVRKEKCCTEQTKGGPSGSPLQRCLSHVRSPWIQLCWMDCRAGQGDSQE